MDLSAYLDLESLAHFSRKTGPNLDFAANLALHA